MIATLSEHMMATGTISGTISLRYRIATPAFWFVRKQTPDNPDLFIGSGQNFSLLGRNYSPCGCRYRRSALPLAAFAEPRTIATSYLQPKWLAR
jgi:hypothetical protein